MPLVHHFRQWARIFSFFPSRDRSVTVSSTVPGPSPTGVGGGGGDGVPLGPGTGVPTSAGSSSVKTTVPRVRSVHEMASTLLSGHVWSDTVRSTGTTTVSGPGAKLTGASNGPIAVTASLRFTRARPLGVGLPVHT